MSELEPMHTLLATLGGQPQVVTFTLDLLLTRGIPIREVIVVHPATHERLQHAVDLLCAEFPADHYRPVGQPMRLRRHVLQQYNRPIDDIVDEQSADGVLNAMDALICDLKRSRRTIHFSITGGRRLLSFLSFSAALLNFGPADRLWHIYTPEDFKQRARDGAIMHAAPEDGVRLIEVPFARLAQPILLRLLNQDAPTARTLIDTQAAREQHKQQQCCRSVVERLSPAQLKVLRAFARGLHPQEVASELDRSIDTIGSHTNVLLRECRNVWDLPEHTRLDYRFLQMMFASYFQST
jgi:CRISPR-associated protein Csx14